RDRGDGPASADEGRERRLGLPLPALEGAALRPRPEPAGGPAQGRLAQRHDPGVRRRCVEPPAADRGGRRAQGGAVRAPAVGVGRLAIALDPPEDLPKVRAAVAGAAGVPVLAASEDVGRSFAILYRHLFMNRQPLPLPTALLLDAEGRVVKAYRDRVDVSEI